MQRIKVSDVAKQVRGVSYKPSDVHEELNDNSVILLRANNISDGTINFDDVVYVDKSKVSQDRYLQRGDILVCASSGSKSLVGKAASITFDSPCTFGAFCKVVRPNEKYTDYLGAFFQSEIYRRRISELALGANINNIRNEHIDSLDLPLYNDDTIHSFVNTIAILQSIITHRKQQLAKLDELVKARFVEMFGDPVHNTFQLPTMPMTNVCEIIDGDRGKNYPKQEEFFSKEYCLFLNAKNVTKHGFNFSECSFITKEKDTILRKGKLQRGDVVLTTRGTLGNLAFYTKDIPFENIRINSGMVILRMNREVINETFFIEQFRMQVDDIKQSIASGSAQPQLPISTMNKINIIISELELQTQFADFVKQVDKSKFIAEIIITTIRRVRLYDQF